MLKLYTDESPGLRVDPVVVLVLSLGFIFSVVGLHGMCGVRPESSANALILVPIAVIAKITRKFSS
jgi:hypothetical protein